MCLFHPNMILSEFLSNKMEQPADQIWFRQKLMTSEINSVEQLRIQIWSRRNYFISGICQLIECLIVSTTKYGLVGTFLLPTRYD